MTFLGRQVRIDWFSLLHHRLVRSCAVKPSCCNSESSALARTWSLSLFSLRLGSAASGGAWSVTCSPTPPVDLAPARSKKCVCLTYPSRLTAFIGEMAGIVSVSRSAVQDLYASVCSILPSTGTIQKMVDCMSKAILPHYEVIGRVTHAPRSITWTKRRGSPKACGTGCG